MNILFSTTLQWNPGDEFILQGIVNLLRQRGLRFNPIPFNRNPAIRPGNTRLDNSFDELRHVPRSIDYAIFAGTPEWLGRRSKPMFDLIANHGLRCAFIGIGSHGGVPELADLERAVFRERTDLVVCRDRSAQDGLARQLPGLRTHLLPCPSIFHGPEPRPRPRAGKVGVIYQTTLTQFQHVTPAERERTIDFIWKLIDRSKVTVICNYIDECVEASAIFGSSLVRYSHRSADYVEFFREVDCVVGARVHGCLGALSLGTPAVLLGLDSDLRRKGVAEQIPLLLQGDLRDVDRLIQTVLSVDVAETSERMLQFREDMRAAYDPLISQLSCFDRPSSDSTPVRDHRAETTYREMLERRSQREQGESGLSRRLRHVLLRVRTKMREHQAKRLHQEILGRS